MQPIGTVLPAVTRRAENPQAPTRYASPASRPAILDREADIEIPNRLWSGWTPKNGKRSIVREFTDEEADIVARRKDALVRGLRPMGDGEPLSAVSEAEWPSDVLIASAKLSAMLGGFRPFRERGEGLKHLVRILLHVLKEFPAWAIVEACDRITNLKVPDINLDWPPSDTRIFAIVRDVVAPYREQLVKTMALLEAPIETPRETVSQPDPTPEQQAQMMAHLAKQAAEDREPSPEAEPGYMARVLADIAARKKERERADG